ncbi:MAG: M48 family metallopeptidase, partial [Myxococcota bacterium]|nr:M48 family metallopeptidase [Myxococcota bacterium]
MMRCLVPFLLFTVACATVPYTNRKQFNLLSSQQELQLGAEAYRDILRQHPKSKNKRWEADLKEVGRNIKRVANERKFAWEFNLLEGSDVNAFALPGGKVAFWEGIMPICKSKDGIAVVMGHEVAHAVAHHGAERVSQGMGLALIGELLSVGLSNGSQEDRQLALSLFGIGATVGAILPWSRGNESEADRIGLILMAKAGYDPREAPRFWTRMSKEGGAKPPELLSTHPSDATRIKKLKEWLPEAQRYYRQNKTNRS